MQQQQLYALAQQYIPGGVNSPVRSFNAVGGTPFFTQRAEDCYLYADNKQYIDYVCSWGANIVGHAHEYVVEQVRQSLSRGFSFGTPSELEVEFAQQINRLLPNVEKFRLVNSGTEAVMAALRVARGYTKRDYIIKFNGCYHGHSDGLLVKAGSGAQTCGHPSSAGIPAAMVQHTLMVEYNDIAGLTAAFQHAAIAAVIIEPFAGNMNLVRPTREFIQTLRDLCQANGSVLIFDEVMTGFRVDLSCAQGLLGIEPDLTVLGKVIGGGMPLAGFGGKAAIMDMLAPVGSVYQAGTLAGNPVAVTAGLATLKLIQAPGFYAQLTATATQLMHGLSQLAHSYGLAFSTDVVGGMFGYYFSASLPAKLAVFTASEQGLFKQFFHGMLEKGVFFAPSMFEAGFVCAKHDAAALATTLAAADEVFAQISTKFKEDSHAKISH